MTRLRINCNVGEGGADPYPSLGLGSPRRQAPPEALISFRVKAKPSSRKEMQELPEDVLAEVLVRLAKPGPMALSCRAAAAAAAAMVRASSPMLGRWAVAHHGGTDAAVHRFACVRPREEVLRAVLAVAPKDPPYLTYCLFRAIEDGACTPGIVDALIQGGADPNAANRPMLHLACAASWRIGLWIVRALLDAGAKADARDFFGMTPLQLVERLGPSFSDVAELLRERIRERDRLPDRDERAGAAGGPAPPESVAAMSEIEASALLSTLTISRVNQNQYIQ